MNQSQTAHWEDLRAQVTRLIQETHVPGVVVGIFHDGEVRAEGFGVTDLEHPLAMTDQTLFQIGSITKTFVSTLVLRLVGQGQLDLDAPVQRYAPDFKVKDPQVSRQVTVRHLLTHVGGWDGDLFADTGAGDDALTRYVPLMADREQVSPLGELFSYNNAGFSLAGYLIERITGKSFPAVLQESVLGPLGLEHSFLAAADVITHRFAVGHTAGSQDAAVLRPWALPRSAWPAGGIICSVHDLLRYARFHLDGGVTAAGDRLLPADLHAQMHSPQIPIYAKNAWGLGWAVDEIGAGAGGIRLSSHSGGTVGQITWLGLAPARQFALAIFTNAAQGRSITRRLAKWVMQEYLGIEQPDPTPSDATTEELAALTGFYTRPFADIELGMLGGRLIGQLIPKGRFPTREAPPAPTPPPVTLALCAPDRLLALDGPTQGETVDIVRKDDGSIGWLRVGARLHAQVP